VDEQVLVLGASYEAASELIRAAARDRGSGFGWHRMTLGRLAAELAQHELAAHRIVQGGMLPGEALCARVIHALHAEGRLGGLRGIADQPGFPRALARTLVELRMACCTARSDPDPFAAGAPGDRPRVLDPASGTGDLAIERHPNASLIGG